MVLVVLAVVAVVAAGAAWVLHRRSGAEVHSVEHYRHALDTLEAVKDRASSASSVRVVGPPSGEGPDGGEAPSGATPARATDRPLAFDDGPGGNYRSSGTRPVGRGPGVGPRPAAWPASRGGRHRRDRAMAAMSRSPRRLGGPLLVGAAAVLLLVVVIVVVAHGARNTGLGASGTQTSSTQTSSTQTSSTQASSTQASGVTRSSSSHHAATRTTTPASYTAVSTSATSATYTPPAASFTVDVAAGSGPCWVQASSPSTGKTVYVGTIPAGQQQAINGAGTLTVLLGAPTVATVTLDGTPVTLPQGFRAPLTLTFTPASG